MSIECNFSNVFLRWLNNLNIYLFSSSFSGLQVLHCQYSLKTIRVLVGVATSSYQRLYQYKLQQIPFIIVTISTNNFTSFSGLSLQVKIRVSQISFHPLLPTLAASKDYPFIRILEY